MTMETMTARELEREVARRRTFAIISHPDAGKTTLTEKFLLYAGAVEEAGSVRARKNARRATSDWMAMEQQRGISVTSTALQFDYDGWRFNLLDTPGHQDFSEDTYRVLTAVDSAVMVLDAARGIEPQTLKLFAVCRQRGIPLVTFVNKMDQPAKDSLELLDEIESVLGIRAVPMTWPIGDGPSFGGVYDLANRRVLRFERTEGNRTKAPVYDMELDDPGINALVGDQAAETLRQQVELVQTVVEPLDAEEFLRGEVTPVFYGSALNNFGVEPFLRDFAKLAPPPRPRDSDAGPIAPTDEAFSGFIFKIQANMDPQHRDRMAFLRVCSGVFERDMTVQHPRLGKKVRVSRPHRLFAQDRETVDTAYPGDIVGLINPGAYRIGDTLCEGKAFQYAAIPRFQPERFAVLENRDIPKAKQFQRGLAQLEEEGAIQVLYPEVGSRTEPMLAAVGELQFDVVKARLADEYGVETALRQTEHTTARRVPHENEGRVDSLPRGTLRTRATDGALVLVFPSDWAAEYVERERPELGLVGIG